MKISINSWALNPMLSISERMKQVKNVGVNFLELNFEENIPNLVLGWDTTKFQLNKLLQISEENNISFSSICTELFWNYSLASNNKTEKSIAIKLGKKMIQVASYLKASSIVVIPCKNLSDINATNPFNTIYTNSIESILELSDFAQEYKIIIGIENVFFNDFLNNPIEFKNFIDEINRDNVKVHFDIGNANLTNYPIAEWLEILDKHIYAIHIKDTLKEVKTLKTFKPLLDGDIEWQPVMEKLKSMNYNNYLILEHSFSNGNFEISELIKRLNKIL